MANLITLSGIGATIVGDGVSTQFTVDFANALTQYNRFNYNGLPPRSLVPVAIVAFFGTDSTTFARAPTSAVLVGSTTVVFTFPVALPAYPHTGGVSVTFGFQGD